VDYILGFLEQYGISGVSMGTIALLIKLSTDKIINFIKDGSKDVSHEHAVNVFESGIDTATRCIGFKVRKIQADKTLVGQPLSISHQFNSAWLDEWKRLQKTVRGASYKGTPLSVYISSTLNAWNEKRDFILECLNEQMNNPNAGTGMIDSLEEDLLRFKHNLEYGSDIWLDTFLNYQEEPKMPKPKKVKKPKVEIPVLEEETKIENA